MIYNANLKIQTLHRFLNSFLHESTVDQIELNTFSLHFYVSTIKWNTIAILNDMVLRMLIVETKYRNRMNCSLTFFRLGILFSYSTISKIR